MRASTRKRRLDNAFYNPVDLLTLEPEPTPEEMQYIVDNRISCEDILQLRFSEKLALLAERARRLSAAVIVAEIRAKPAVVSILREHRLRGGKG